jgi:hypothetical protein
VLHLQPLVSRQTGAVQTQSLCDFKYSQSFQIRMHRNQS